MRKNKIIYWIATGLMSILFFAGAMMYLFNYSRAEAFFVNLGFPIWIIYPLAVLKILGVVAILTNKSKFLKEVAYGGFLFDAILALTAHIIISDGEYMPAIISIILIILSWVYDRKVYGSYSTLLKSETVIVKREKVIYWITTGLICFLFGSGALMYIFNYDYAHHFFASLGFPTWIIYPLAVLKILGPVAILTRKSLFLKELAYVGFLFDAILAVTAHLMVGDGFIYHGIAAVIFTIVSWKYDRKLFGTYTQKLAAK